MLRVFSDGLVATLHNTVGGTDRAETNEASMLVLERACPSKVVQKAPKQPKLQNHPSLLTEATGRMRLSLAPAGNSADPGLQQRWL